MCIKELDSKHIVISKCMDGRQIQMKYLASSFINMDEIHQKIKKSIKYNYK